MSVPSNTEIHECAQRLALELTDSGRWRYDAGRHSDHDVSGLEQCATIRRDDGLELTVGTDRSYGARNGKPKFQIRQSMNCDAWTDSDGGYNARVDPLAYLAGGGRESLPSINVAVSKTPAVIARDVQRRVLPDAQRFHAKALEMVASRNANNDDRDAYAAAMGCEPAHDGRDPSRRVYQSKTPDGVGTVEIEVSSSGITIKADGLSTKRAQAVLAALGLKVQRPPT